MHYIIYYTELSTKLSNAINLFLNYSYPLKEALFIKSKCILFRLSDAHSCRFIGKSSQCACLCYDSGKARHAVGGTVKEKCNMQWNWQEHKCQCMPGRPAKWDLCFKGQKQHADFRQETPQWGRSSASVVP